jgi:hypothetical protein
MSEQNRQDDNKNRDLEGLLRAPTVAVNNSEGRILIDDDKRSFQLIKDKKLINQMSGKNVVSSSQIRIRLIKLTAFVQQQYPRRFQDCHESEFLDFNEARFIISISHPWKTKEHPDPEGKDVIEVHNWVKQNQGLMMENGFPISTSSIGIFYDYNCVTQRPRTENEERLFKVQLKNMNLVYALSDVVLIVGAQIDYDLKGWCVFESMIGMMMSRLIDPSQVAQKCKKTMSIDLMFRDVTTTNESDLNDLIQMVKDLVQRKQFRPLADNSRINVPLRVPRDHHNWFTINTTTNTVYCQVDGFRDVLSGNRQIMQRQIEQNLPPCTESCANLFCYFPCVRSWCNDYSKLYNLPKIRSWERQTGNIKLKMVETYDHKMDYTLNPTNIEEDLKLLIREAYGNFRNFVHNADSDTVDWEILLLLSRMNAIILNVKEELAPPKQSMT